MASNVEYSSNNNPKRAIKPAHARRKPPDKIYPNEATHPIPPAHIVTPLHSPTLSYVSDTPESHTPTQTLGKRRLEDPTEPDRNRGPPPPIPNTPKPTRTIPPPHAPMSIDPIQLVTNQTQDQDLAPMDPAEDINFFGPTQDMIPTQEIWSDKDYQIDRLNRARVISSELIYLLEAADADGCVNFILGDKIIEDNLAKLSSIFPTSPSNLLLKPLSTGLSDLQKMVSEMAQKLDKLDNQPSYEHPNKTLHGSIHAPIGPYNTPPSKPTQPTPPKQPSTPNNPQPENLKNNPALPKTPLNPNSSHHPSRLIAQFLPRGIPPDNRPDPCSLATQINTALTANRTSKHLKVVAASFNNHGNLIISTRADQTAEELLKHKDIIIPALHNSLGNRETILREDKKWYKIQIDGMNTGSLTIGGIRKMYLPEEIHTELLNCNPIYANAQNIIASKPRWLRTEEELRTTHRSSLVFALTDENTAKLILSYRSLAAFGKHCSVKAFQDRPPVTQCRICWSLEHPTHKCTDPNRCRLCSDPHHEGDHIKSYPNECPKCISSAEAGDSMATDDPNFCPHDLRCINCLDNPNVEHDHTADARRCPARLKKYGTAREDERRAAQSNNPWIKAKTRKTKPKSSLTSNAKNTSLTTPNRFEALNPSNTSIPTLPATPTPPL